MISRARATVLRMSGVRRPQRPHAHLRRAARDLRAGRGVGAVGQRRQALPRLPVAGWPSPGSATPTPPWPRPWPSRPARCCTCRTSSATPWGPRWRSPSTGWWAAEPPRRRAGVLHQLGGRGQRVRAQAGPQVGGPGPPRGGEHLGRLPRPDPGHAARHRPTREARALRTRCPRASSTSPTTTSTPWTRPATRRGWRPCSSSPSRARRGSSRRRRTTSAAVRELCTERGILLMVDEIQTGSGPHGPVVRASSTPASSPTWSPWPRRSATACPSARAGPGPRWRRPSRPATTAAPSAASRWPRRRRGPPWRSWRPRTSRPGPRRAGARLRAGLEALDGVVGRAGRGAPARRRPRRPAGQGGGRRGAGAGPGGERAATRHHPPGAVAAGERRRDRRGAGHARPARGRRAAGAPEEAAS